MAHKSTTGVGPKTAKSGREDRLKAALKANMGRRKAQARARTDANAGDTDDQAAQPADE